MSRVGMSLPFVPVCARAINLLEVEVVGYAYFDCVYAF